MRDNAANNSGDSNREDDEQILIYVDKINWEFDNMTARLRIDNAGLTLLSGQLQRMTGSSAPKPDDVVRPESLEQINQSLARQKALGQSLCEAASTYAQELIHWAEDLGQRRRNSDSSDAKHGDGLKGGFEHSAAGGTQSGDDRLTGWLTGGWHTGVTGSIFGGKAEPQESWYNGRGYYDGKLMLDSDNMPGVALPAEDLFGRNVEIYNLSNGRSVIAPVVDVGPHAFEDDNYVYNFGMPIGENYSNRSGIDLLPQTARDLGIKYVRGSDGYEPVGRDPVLNWRFVE